MHAARATDMTLLFVILALLGLYFSPRTDTGIWWVLWMACEAWLIIAACLSSQGWTWTW